MIRNGNVIGALYGTPQGNSNKVSGIFALNNGVINNIKPSILGLGYSEILTDTTSYTYSGVASDQGNGLYIISIHTEGAATSISSCTLNGSSMSVWVNQTTTASTGRNIFGIASIYYEGFLGTSSIVVNLNGTNSRCAICVYFMKYVLSTTPITYGSISYDSGRTSHSVTLNNAIQNGGLIAGTTFSDAGIRVTYNLGSEQVDKDFVTEVNTAYSSMVSMIDVTQNLTVSVTHTATSTPSSFGAAVWR